MEGKVILLIVIVMYVVKVSVDQNHADGFQPNVLDRRPLKMMMLSHFEDIWPNGDKLNTSSTLIDLILVTAAWIICMMIINLKTREIQPKEIKQPNK